MKNVGVIDAAVLKYGISRKTRLKFWYVIL